MTDWTLVTAVLGVGLALGVVFFFFTGRKGPAAPTLRGSLRDLQVRRDTLIARLRDLELGDRRSAEERDAERYALELEAAEVLRALHQEEQRPATAAPSAQSAPATSGVRGFLWGIGTAAFFVLLTGLLFQFSKERTEGAPLTGGVDGIEFGNPRAQAPQQDPELEALLQASTASPQDLDAKLNLIQGLIFRDRLVDAWPFIQEAAALAPENGRVLLYEAIVREAMGELDQARALLDRAVKSDPSLSEAWVRRGLIAFEAGDWAVSVESWETALEQRPDGREALEPVIAEAKRRLAVGAPPPERAAPQAPGSPSAGAQAAPGSATAAADTSAITVDVLLSDAAQAKATPGGFVFVTARQSGATGGPPIAAKRIPVGELPVRFTMGQADSMMGQPFPASALIEARLDADGDATTRSPDDPSASADDVAQGASIRLVLD